MNPESKDNKDNKGAILIGAGIALGAGFGAALGAGIGAATGNMGFWSGIGVAFGGPNQPPLEIDFAWALRDRSTDHRQLVSIAFSRDF